MYKRALMLTAATVALVSGPAFGAATTITTKTTKPLTTAADGPITLTTSTSGSGVGSIVIPAVSSASAAAAAIEINSTTPANNVFTGAAGSLVSFNDTSYAEGIQADPGVTGEIVSGGTIDLTGDGTNKAGIVFGNAIVTTTTAGTFTGIADTTNDPVNANLPYSQANPNGLLALILQPGSTLAVQGDGSSDIEVITGNTVTGDIIISGAATDEATSLTAATNASVVTAVDMLGTLNGNFYVTPTGSLIATGGGAEGIVDLGQINGSITNFGVIESVGTATVKSTGGNPEAGSALVIGNNVTGGIYNGGPGDGDTTTARAVISTSGTSAALDITPDFNGSVAAAPITIGGYADPLKVFGSVSLLNRGSITAVPTNPDVDSTAIAISGISAVNDTTLSNGVVNAGAITASAVTDAKADAATTTTTVTALAIGDFVNVVPNSGTANNGFGGGDALVNSNESASTSTGGGTISATVSGEGPGTAVAIDIGSTSTTTGTTVPSLYNSGTISATATSTDLTISNLAAYAILDNSGTLLNITNTGTITAASSALNNFANVAEAINVQNAVSGVTIVNSGTIVGDIYLGGSADTIELLGQNSKSVARISGNIFFGGGVNNVPDTLTVGNYSAVTGNILAQGGEIAIDIQNAGTLDVLNNGTTINNLPISKFTGVGAGNLDVSSLTVENNGTLDLTLAQAFNQPSNSNSAIVPVVQSSTADGGFGTITLSAGSALNLNFGSFVSSNNLSSGGNTSSSFVIFDAPTGQLIIAEPQAIITDITKDIPFLFNGSVCAYGVTGFTGANACTTAPEGAGRSDLVLSLTPKAAGVNPTTGLPDENYLGLTGYAAKMFPFANKALALDPTLGAAVIAAGANLTGTNSQSVQDVYKSGQALYQGIYSSFAPDVTGADRAIAISITDQATGPVGARQRELRMYAGLDGDATLWGQEFGQRLNTGGSPDTTGYANTGFGFALGADSGDPHDGRYGGAFTFYSGTTSEKPPRTSKTRSEWAMLTGYSDWRGHGFFFDSQLSAAYGNITGKRSIVINDVVANCNDGVACTTQGKRAAALLAGGATAGTIYHSGGTVFIPQISLDGLTMREEGYTEATPNLVTQATSGFDLHVKPYYANSLRAFAGADLRQDLKFGEYFVQPEARAGFRYDFIDGAQKLKFEFACSAVATGGCGDTGFTLTGPDPSRENLVLGGGIAVTTGAWSLGLNYDYLRGVDGVKTTDQVATFTLIGRI